MGYYRIRKSATPTPYEIFMDGVFDIIYEDTNGIEQTYHETNVGTTGSYNGYHFIYVDSNGVIKISQGDRGYVENSFTSNKDYFYITDNLDFVTEETSFMGITGFTKNACYSHRTDIIDYEYADEIDFSQASYDDFNNFHAEDYDYKMNTLDLYNTLNNAIYHNIYFNSFNGIICYNKKVYKDVVDIGVDDDKLCITFTAGSMKITPSLEEDLYIMKNASIGFHNDNTIKNFLANSIYSTLYIKNVALTIGGMGIHHNIEGDDYFNITFPNGYIGASTDDDNDSIIVYDESMITIYENETYFELRIKYDKQLLTFNNFSVNNDDNNAFYEETNNSYDNVYLKINSLPTPTSLMIITITYKEIAFELMLYKYNGRSNKIHKTLTISKKLIGNLVEDTSIISPKILIITSDSSYNKVTPDIVDYNYAYIPKFKRYYFITDKINKGKDLWEITLKVDVLMSNADSINDMTITLSRCSLFNEHKLDSLIPRTNVKSTITNATGNNVLTALTKGIKTTINQNIVFKNYCYCYVLNLIGFGELWDINVNWYGEHILPITKYNKTQNLSPSSSKGIFNAVTKIGTSNTNVLSFVFYNERDLKEAIRQLKDNSEEDRILNILGFPFDIVKNIDEFNFTGTGALVDKDIVWTTTEKSATGICDAIKPYVSWSWQYSNWTDGTAIIKDCPYFNIESREWGGVHYYAYPSETLKKEYNKTYELQPLLDAPLICSSIANILNLGNVVFATGQQGVGEVEDDDFEKEIHFILPYFNDFKTSYDEILTDVKYNFYYLIDITKGTSSIVITNDYGEIKCISEVQMISNIGFATDNQHQIDLVEEQAKTNLISKGIITALTIIGSIAMAVASEGALTPVAVGAITGAVGYGASAVQDIQKINNQVLKVSNSSIGSYTTGSKFCPQIIVEYYWYPTIDAKKIHDDYGYLTERTIVFSDYASSLSVGTKYIQGSLHNPVFDYTTTLQEEQEFIRLFAEGVYW